MKKRLLLLTLSGAFIFWIVSFFTSLLPLAAQYRAAYSNWSAQTVWIGAAFAGLLFSFCVSFVNLRFYERIPAKTPIQKALMITAITLILAILLISLPQHLRSAQKSLQFFLVGILFDAVRFFMMGLTIGLMNRKRNGKLKSNSQL